MVDTGFRCTLKIVLTGDDELSRNGELPAVSKITFWHLKKI